MKKVKQTSLRAFDQHNIRMMETFFMNAKNSKTNEPNKFIYHLSDRLNLKNSKKNLALANLSIYYTWKNLKKAIITINLKYLHQLGIKLLIYQLDHIQLQAFKTILNT